MFVRGRACPGHPRPAAHVLPVSVDARLKAGHERLVSEPDGISSRRDSPEANKRGRPARLEPQRGRQGFRAHRSERPALGRKPALLLRRLVPRNLKPNGEGRGRAPGISARRPPIAPGGTEPWLNVDAAHVETAFIMPNPEIRRNHIVPRCFAAATAQSAKGIFGNMLRII